MATLEEAYKKNELDNYFSNYSYETEFQTQFEKLTDLPKFERSLWLKPCLIKKFGVKREDLVIVGSLYNHTGYCLQDTTTYIYYAVNPYKWDTETDNYVCYYLFQNNVNTSDTDIKEYKTKLASFHSLNENDIVFLGVTYDYGNQYCFRDIVKHIFYLVSKDGVVNYLFANQCPDDNFHSGFTKDPVTKLYLEY